MLIRKNMKSPHRYSILANNISDFNDTVNEIFEVPYSDEPDPDIDKLKSDLITMRDHVYDIADELNLIDHSKELK